MKEPVLMDYIRVVRQSLWLWLVIVVFHVALAIAAAFYLSPVYRSELIVAPVPQGSANGLLGNVASQLGGLSQLVGIQDQGAIGKDELIALLGSREFAREFIHERKLQPILFYKIWDATTETWMVDSEEDVPSEIDAIRAFRENVMQISEARRTTGLVTVSFEWIDRHQAAEWATAYLEFANNKIRQRTITEAQRSIQYLNDELAKTSIVELRTAIYSLIETQINRIMVANVRDEYAFKIVDSAFVPDPDEFVRPNRPLIVLGGFVFGLLMATVLVVLRQAIRDRGDMQ